MYTTYKQIGSWIMAQVRSITSFDTSYIPRFTEKVDRPPPARATNCLYRQLKRNPATYHQRTKCTDLQLCTDIAQFMRFF